MNSMPDPFNSFLDMPQVPVSNAENGPLAGLRLTVKDIYDVAGLVTGCGNPGKAASSLPADKTAASVQVILDAGARFVGKTQTDELTFSLMGQNAHYPQPVNSAAPGRVTGGSSSGSAAAIAGGLADIATASDTGGSVRAPASFCGLIGLRLTHGRVSLAGAMPLAPSLDTFGWFARDAETYARVGDVMLPQGAGLESPRPMRLAALDSLVLGEAEAVEYERMVAASTGVLGPVAMARPLRDATVDLYMIFRRIQAYEAWAIHGDWISSADRGLGPGVRERFEFGSTLGCEVATAETKRRNAFREDLAELLGSDGILLMPTVPGAAPLSVTPFDEIQAYRERALQLLCLSGLSGFPQITVPLGTVDGAPFGLSLLGPPDSDRALLDLAGRLMQAAGRA